MQTGSSTERVGKALSDAGIHGWALAVAGLAGMIGAAGLAVTGRFVAAGIALAAGGVAVGAARIAMRSGGFRSRWVEYLCIVAGRVGDAPVFATIAWWVRLTQPRTSLAAVVALSLVLLGAYAEVKAIALAYRPPKPFAGSVERAAVVSAGLLIPGAAEAALWIVAASGLTTFVRIALAVWQQAAAASGGDAPAA